MKTRATRFATIAALGNLAMYVLLAAAIFAACIFAPTEQTMGHAQRIVYVHVAVAWFGLLAFVAMAFCGIGYLARRDLKWDHRAQAWGEVGWLCCGLTLVSGSLWAHEAWGTWWVWDPRLTASFILWAVYSGILIVRAGLEDARQRARIGAVLAILGMLDIPLVVMATRWFRGMHPVAPEMTPAMRLTLLITVLSFTVFFAVLVRRRASQLRLQSAANSLRLEMEPG
jgi:heme exporter protein C